MPSSLPNAFPEPVFIGGFGRSGTHAVGPLVAAHPRYHRVRTEARFHAVRGGLPDLLAGETELGKFVERCRGTWWKRGWADLEGLPGVSDQGLQRIVERAELEAALANLERGFPDDPWEASRRFMRAVLDPGAHRKGKPSWVELTGRSILYAPTLLRLFPRGKFINMVRDGRSVVGGHLKKIDMTDDPMEALMKWERMIRGSHDAISAVPEESVLVIQLDDLVARDRERTYARIVEFLEIDDDAPMREHFDRRITAKRAHVDAWRDRMPPPEARRVDRRYRRLIRRLHRDGVWWAPAPRDGRVRIGARRVAAG